MLGIRLFFLRLCHFLGKNLILLGNPEALGRGMAELSEPYPPEADRASCSATAAR